MIFSKATVVHRDDEGTSSAELDQDWSVGRRLHGGYLLCQARQLAVIPR
ncbi:MAG: hypothetical protein LC799_13970 [Actinobacteria bacterium]|nr:hypothetical protein [Actinomycetota bacterium]